MIHWPNKTERTLLRHPGLTDWLLTGERGISSNTIVTRLVGIDVERDHWGGEPSDPADFRRCERLLREVPSLRGRFERQMPKLSPYWALLVLHWNEIVGLINLECPGALDKKGWTEGRAPHAYALMHALRGESGDLIWRDSPFRFGSGSWYWSDYMPLKSRTRAGVHA